MQVSQTDVLNLIEPHFEKYIIEKSYSVNNLPAINFLNHSRFDLAFKLLYLDMLENNIDFSKEAYKEHIRAFSLGKYTEAGNNNKNSIESFYNEFENTYRNIEKYGFDNTKTIVPLSENSNILNGAHRVASAIKLNKNVDCIVLPTVDLNYDYKFFYNRNVPVEMLDAAALKFIEYSKNIYIACIWPTAQGHDSEIERVIPNIVYRKNIELNYNGAHNLISQIYTGEAWLGSVSDNFQGAQGKLIECFKQQAPVRIVAFQADNLEVVLEIKENIRSLFNVGKHSIHITDTEEEAFNTAQLVFSDNSIHFLNYAKPNNFQNFHQRLNEVKTFLRLNKIDESNFVLDDEIILAAYGLRQVSNISYLISDASAVIAPLNDSNFYDTELKYHRKSKNELMYDSNNHFYFQGLKFVSISQLLIMKTNRAGKKDKNDCKLMQDLIKNNKIQKKFVQIKQSIFYNKIIIKAKSVELLQKTGLFKPVSSILKIIKSKT